MRETTRQLGMNISMRAYMVTQKSALSGHAWAYHHQLLWDKVQGDLISYK